MGWRIDYDGHTFRESDVTLAQAEQMETLTGYRWTYIDPKVEAKHARVVLSVMYAHAANVTVDEAREKVEALRVDAFLDMLSEEEGDLPSEFDSGFPPKADGSSTPT